jgi:hypothetical protein
MVFARGQVESKAIDEFFEKNKINLPVKRFEWSPNSGGYVIKVID